MKKKPSAKPFYHQWVKTERIYCHVQKAGLKKQEEEEIWSLIEETIHMRAIDAVLEKLPANKHEEFLEKFHREPDDLKLMAYLRHHIADVEKHLEATFSKLEREILKDLNL